MNPFGYPSVEPVEIKILLRHYDYWREHYPEYGVKLFDCGELSIKEIIDNFIKFSRPRIEQAVDVHCTGDFISILSRLVVEYCGKYLYDKELERDVMISFVNWCGGQFGIDWGMT